MASDGCIGIAKLDIHHMVRCDQWRKQLHQQIWFYCDRGLQINKESFRQQVAIAFKLTNLIYLTWVIIFEKQYLIGKE